MSTPVADQFSVSISSTINFFNLAGSWILFCALRKITPRVPGCLAKVSKMWRYAFFKLLRVVVQQALPRAICGHNLLRVDGSCLALVRHF